MPFSGGCGHSLYYIRKYLPSFDSRFYARALAGSAVPFVVVHVLSFFVSDRVLASVPYTILGALLFVARAKAKKLVTQEDKAYLSHLIPGQLRWLLHLL